MTGRPTELVGMGYLTDAKAYLKAGNALSQSDIEMYSPVYFLLCHAIELSLKAFILASGGSERELKQQDTRHHLNVLRDRACALGYQSANEKTDEVIEMLAPYHSNHSFRYKDPGYASLPIIADTIDVNAGRDQSGRLAKGAIDVTLAAKPVTRSAPRRRARCRAPAASRSPGRRYRCRDNRTRNRPGDRALPVARRRGFGSFHRQAQGALTAPAQAERYRGSREGTFHRILRS